MIVLCAHRLYTPREEIVNPLLFIEDGLIASISSRAEQEIPNAATVVDFNRDDPHGILAPDWTGCARLKPATLRKTHRE